MEPKRAHTPARRHRRKTLKSHVPAVMLPGQVIVKMVVAGRAAKNTRFFFARYGAFGTALLSRQWANEGPRAKLKEMKAQKAKMEKR